MKNLNVNLKREGNLDYKWHKDKVFIFYDLDWNDQYFAVFSVFLFNGMWF